MSKKFIILFSCTVIMTFVSGISEVFACTSNYIEYNGLCYRKLDCKNGGTQQADKCKCKSGWKGSLCQTAKTCSYKTTKCNTGYVVEETCYSGNNKYVKCKANPCSGYSKSCKSGYVADGTCLSGKTKMYLCKKDVCVHGSKKSDGKCKCSTGYTGIVCDKIAKGYVDLGRGVLACAAGYKKDSKGKCVAKPADKVGAYLLNGINNKTITVKNTSDADVYGISTQDNVNVSVNNAYADRKDAKGTIKITNSGNGDVYGIANDETSGNNAYAYKGVAEGNITINNTGDGNVYGAVHDGNSLGGYYNARTMRGGQAFGYINITNKGNGYVLGSNNNSYAAGESAASGSIVIKNTGDAKVTGVDSNNVNTHSSGIAYGSININNKGNGDLLGSKSYNAYSNDNSEAYGYIDIVNKGNGSVKGSNSTNAYSSGNSKAYGSINIDNQGDGTVLGTKSSNASTAYDSNTATVSAYVVIKNKGNGNVFGSGSYNVYGYEGSSSAKINASIKINNTGDGEVVGAYNENVDTYNFFGKASGNIDIVNKGDGNVYGVKGSYNSDGNSSSAVDNAIGRIKITYNGKGSAYGVYTSSSYAYNVYNASNSTGYIDMINQSSGTVFAISGRNVSVRSVGGGGGKSYIKVINLGNGTGYGMENMGTIENISDGKGKQSVIEMVNKANGLVVAMRGNRQAINSGEINIHNLGDGTAIGMYVSGSMYNYDSMIRNFDYYKEYWHQNSGTIVIDRSNYTYDKGTTKKSDDVTYASQTAIGGRAIGVYVASGALFFNTGSIVINNAETAYGIYVEQGGTARNEGTITIDGNQNGYRSVVLNRSSLFQDGVLKVSSVPNMQSVAESMSIANVATPKVASLNLNDFGGTVVASNTSQFIVEGALSGDLAMNNSIIENGFDTTYSVKDMIQAGDTSGLNLHSQSALFDATLKNDSDAVMTMKSFNDVIANQSLADFLKQNYAAENNEELFGMLKGQETVAALNSTLDSITGSEVFNRFNFEDMTMMRELNMDVNNKLFNDKQDYLTTSGTIAPFYFDSENGADGKYALYNHRIGKKSFGLSLAFANINSSDRKDNNQRNDESFQMSVPFGYNTHGFKFITAPRFGYAYGHYDRDGFESRTYKGTMEKRMFGLMNEARYPIAAGKWSIAPAVEFNMLGYHLKGSEEAQEYSLNIKSQNNYSVESGIGLYANREMKLTKDSTLKLNAGIAVYHEFADPYTMELGMYNMNGSFKIRDERRKDNRAVVRTGFDYSMGDITVEGNFATFVDGTTHTQAGLDLKYNF